MIGPGKSSHCQTWLERHFSWNELTAKAEFNFEIYKTWRKCWKNRHFLSWEQPCELKTSDIALNIGTGIYTQHKRNAYKIDPIKHTYGKLSIDIPKLYGRLKLIAHKDGQKVYDKQVHFDTLDMLTKKFSRKKKYSQ